MKKPARERYSLRPHQVRELIRLASRASSQYDLKALSTYFGVSLKTVVETLKFNGFDPDSIGVAEKPVEEKPRKEKLKLSFESKKKLEKAVPSKEEELVSRKLSLDKRELDIEQREKALLNRERQLEQDRMDVEACLERVDAGPTSEQLQAKDAEIADLHARIAVLSDSARDSLTSGTLRLMSYGTVRQMLLTATAKRDAEIHALKTEIRDLKERLKNRIPESIMV